MWFLPWKKKDKGSPSSKRKGGDSANSSPSGTPRSSTAVSKSYGVQIAAAYRAPGSKV